jgi:acetylornithine deacetylase/succinyl-diaminopimelate desuccinylase-like protein
MTKIQQKHIDRYLRKEKKRFEEVLCRLVEIPSISMDPKHRQDIQRAAEAGVKIIRDAGGRARMVTTPGYPVVFGQFLNHSHYPTVTVYNHLDVQPADESEWKRPAFKFKIQGERYLGRGATDDKGPAVTALMAARYAAENGIPLNIQFIWELEEEIGSPHFEDFLKKMRQEVRTDSVIVSDTIWLGKRRPAIPYGLRGLLAVRLMLETASQDVHSGLTGGAARNPVTELCQVINACLDAETGRVKIPEFYDDVVPLRKDEIRGFSSSDFSVSRFKKAHGLRYLKTTDRLEVMRRIWTQPTFEVHGISGGYQGPGVKTAIASRAEAKVSMRLVPHQDPQKIYMKLRRFVQKVNPQICMTPVGLLEPYLGQSSGPYAQAARHAFQFAFGREPAFVREGGSIGAVVTMDQYLKAPMVFMGLSLPEHGYHAPNEYFDWGQASGGVKAFVRYFDEIARIPVKH